MRSLDRLQDTSRPAGAHPRALRNQRSSSTIAKRRKSERLKIVGLNLPLAVARFSLAVCRGSVAVLVSRGGIFFRPSPRNIQLGGLPFFFFRHRSAFSACSTRLRGDSPTSTPRYRAASWGGGRDPWLST